MGQSCIPREFSNWLRCFKDGQKGRYWISGKIGSGKSTLMRYLDINIDQTEHIAAWAEEVRVLKAQYFCWNPAASGLQKVSHWSLPIFVVPAL